MQIRQKELKREDLLFFDSFKSPTHGNLDFDGVLEKLLEYMGNEPRLGYELIIGTDSFLHNGHLAEFVTALVVHRKNRGGIYFWSKRSQEHMHTLRQRIFEEALSSLRLAEQLIAQLKARDITEFDLSIHVDIGPNGATRQMLHEITGMIVGNGFAVKTKPDSYGASSVADRHT